MRIFAVTSGYPAVAGPAYQQTKTMAGPAFLGKDRAKPTTEPTSPPQISPDETAPQMDALSNTLPQPALKKLEIPAAAPKPQPKPAAPMPADFKPPAKKDVIPPVHLPKKYLNQLRKLVGQREPYDAVVVYPKKDIFNEPTRDMRVLSFNGTYMLEPVAGLLYFHKMGDYGVSVGEWNYKIDPKTGRIKYKSSIAQHGALKRRSEFEAYQRRANNEYYEAYVARELKAQRHPGRELPELDDSKIITAADLKAVQEMIDKANPGLLAQLTSKAHRVHKFRPPFE